MVTQAASSGKLSLWWLYPASVILWQTCPLLFCTPEFSKRLSPLQQSDLVLVTWGLVMLGDKATSIDGGKTRWGSTWFNPQVHALSFSPPDCAPMGRVNLGSTETWSKDDVKLSQTRNNGCCKKVKFQRIMLMWCQKLGAPAWSNFLSTGEVPITLSPGAKPRRSLLSNQPRTRPAKPPVSQVNSKTMTLCRAYAASHCNLFVGELSPTR